ncbi:glycosyltransferase family 2 protein [Paraglaciecola polaris]|uniref:Glycosyl transferase, family 2 protein n=1 Tax=Paraglaciecola polaris LMG 21857 TaxID=1129793 RepID=K7AA25_9ALTE|nr:glycosyltransferase family 2 protein [Paraglaciecola polaris]GAC32250.1 glycosyl transferase, family 2 protein [Paraglaciecola polaris LMG 21857]
MKESPLVSIILPVYNVELYLAECLDSVLTQSYRNFELIAVNDGSTDNSNNILLEYQDKFLEKLVVVEQPNKGLSAARNTGLDKVKGEFVYFLDSDDWILTDTLEKCVNTLVKDNSDLVVFNAKAFCDDMPVGLLDKLDYTRNLPKEHYNNGHQLFVDSRCEGTYIVQSCCYIYRYNSHPALRFIEGILHEDHYFSTSLFLSSSNIHVLTDRFFQRRIRKNSITTSSLSMKHATGYYETAAILHKELSEKSIQSKELSEYYNYMIYTGIKIEREIRQGHMSFTRKIELISTFNSILTFKERLRIMSPRFYNKLVDTLKKS